MAVAKTGQVSIGTSATTLAAALSLDTGYACSSVLLWPDSSNAGFVYLGVSSAVTTSTGSQINRMVPVVPNGNVLTLGEVHLIASQASQVLHYEIIP